MPQIARITDTTMETNDDQLDWCLRACEAEEREIEDTSPDVQGNTSNSSQPAQASVTPQAAQAPAGILATVASMPDERQASLQRGS